MTANGWLQIGVYLLILLAITKPMGVFMARVFAGEKTFLDPALRPLERLLYRITGIDDKREMDWKEYTIAMLLFSGVSMLVLYLIERVQQLLAVEPAAFPQAWRPTLPSTRQPRSPRTRTGRTMPANQR